jgi:hypothetical protein
MYVEETKDDENFDYDHTLIDDSSAKGGDKEKCSVTRRKLVHFNRPCD